ncbi:MAG: TonB-dependent receptor [Rubrivivax sp.]|nr:TonB-dependent receptor [Rubrivivax sp.]
MKLRLVRHSHTLALALSATSAPGLLLAQQGPASAQSTPPLATGPALQSVIVTGNPLRSTDISTPTSVLAGGALVLRRGSTLGETLDGLPGVSSSYFGPNANRPMIRGQDGDRIRMLSNSGVALDASGLSYDHAVPIDPMVIERVEVLRGPAALLYGGSAVGGVVNAIDNRIPKARNGGITGAAELRYGGPAAERGASAIVEAGGTGFVVHADGFWRQTDDMKVPSYPRPDGSGGFETAGRIVNSASKSHGGALGASMVWGQGYFGASVDSFNSEYGTVAEADVTIDMASNKLTLAGEVRDLGGFVSAVIGQWLVSDYRHQEIEGGEVGTTFKTKGSDLRLQAQHMKLSVGGGSLAGVFGLQTENADFSALGAEAFVPGTTTRQYGLFFLEEFSKGAATLSFGGRVGRSTVQSAGDAPGQTQFGAARSRSFTPFSAALGAVVRLSPLWQLSAHLAYTERAPTFYELYANGLHVATGAYEVGNPDMAVEKGGNLDVAVQWKQGAHRARAGVFYGDLSNYIALLGTGRAEITAAGPVPVFAFTGVPAKLYGVEFEGHWRLLDGSRQVELDGKLDLMRATNETAGQPLPRIPPARLTTGVNWTTSGWAARAEVIFAAAQDRVPADDLATPAYTLVNLALSYKLRVTDADGHFFLKFNNVGNALAYNATSIATVRPSAPLPGRGLMAGVRLTF